MLCNIGTGPGIGGSTIGLTTALCVLVIAATFSTGCAGLMGCGQFCNEEFWVTADASDVEKQFKRGADIFSEPQNGYVRAPLRWAAQYGDRDVIKLVLDHSEGREDGKELRSALLSEAVRYSAPDVLALFFDQGVHIYAAEDELLLHNAVASSNRPAVELLLEYGADVSRRGPAGRTPLHVAAGSARPELVELLLDRGADADIRAVSVNGDTPLHDAARGSESQHEVILALLDRGAGDDANRANDNGATPLHRAVGSPWADPKAIELLLARGADLHARTRQGETPLHVAARRAELPVIAALLELGADADIGAQSDPGDTPLHAAIMSDDPMVIALLVDWGAEVSARNDLGLTPLHTAAQYGPPPGVLLALIDYGADVNARDHGGWTPLMHAACCPARNTDLFSAGGVAAQTARSVETIQLLLANGAEVSARSYDGLTACEYAELAFDPFSGEVRPLVCQ